MPPSQAWNERGKARITRSVQGRHDVGRPFMRLNFFGLLGLQRGDGKRQALGSCSASDLTRIRRGERRQCLAKAHAEEGICQGLCGDALKQPVLRSLGSMCAVRFLLMKEFRQHGLFILCTLMNIHHQVQLGTFAHCS